VGLLIQVLDFGLTAEAISAVRTRDSSFDFQATQGFGTFLQVLSFVVWALSAYCFLRVVWRAKQFLSEVGRLDLPGFGTTVFSFAIPFANFYVPWNRLGIIKKSLHHFAKSRSFELVTRGWSGVIVLGALYLFAALIGRVAMTMPVNTIDDLEALNSFGFFATIAWLASFLFAAAWLSGLCRDLRVAKSPSGAPPLQSLEGASSTVAAAQRQIPVGPSGTTSSGFLRDVQLALISRGYDAGSADGQHGELLQEALRLFQERQGLPVTGSVDLATVRELGLTTKHPE
jgi:hypothetical protein